MPYMDNFDDISNFDFWISSPLLLSELSSFSNLYTLTEEEKLSKFFKQKLYESSRELSKNKSPSVLSTCVNILNTHDLSAQNQFHCLKLLANLSLENAAKENFKSAGLLKWVQRLSENDKPEIFLEAWKILQNLDSNGDAVKYRDCIYPLISPWKKEQEPVIDVVLVHGINGGASWTWRQHDSKRNNPALQQDQRRRLLTSCGKDDAVKECLLNETYSWIWPLDWLKQRISKPFRIIAVDYPAGWRNSDGEEIQDRDLTALSEDILRQLKAAGVGGRPIIWVTHSMGGLIVKTIMKLEACCECEKIAPSHNTLSSTRAVIFLSVPHLGTPLASWICYLAPFFKPSRFIYDLKAGCPKLAETHEVFIRLCKTKSIQVLTLNETKPISVTKNGPNVLFVPSKCGNPGIGEYFEVNASHLDVCKPTARSDESFKIIEDFVMKIFRNLPTS